MLKSKPATLRRFAGLMLLLAVCLSLLGVARAEDLDSDRAVENHVEIVEIEDAGNTGNSGGKTAPSEIPEDGDVVISENGRVMANPETGFIGYWTAERYIALAGMFVLLAAGLGFIAFRRRRHSD